MFSAWATFLRLFAGTQPFASKSVSYGAMIGVYLIGGPVAGAVVGLCRPILSNAAGAFLAGFLGGTVLGLAARVAVFGFTPFGVKDLFVVAPIALGVGPVATMLTWSWSADRSPPPSR
jgi:hypothetical protein